MAVTLKQRMMSERSPGGRNLRTRRQHTTVNLDMQLMGEAQRILGTRQVTETIHRALQEIVNRDKRRRLLDLGLGDMTPEMLEEMRRNSSFTPTDTEQVV
jgi:Arc/MetJ family transcription regulator